tara:strand:+ start:1078 stop:1911 length:834 start_codon:yes stop_codon:yes gene_type:complete
MSFLGGGRSRTPSTPSTTTQIVREAPGIEERKLELMDIARQVAQKPINLPTIQVAPLSQLEQQATRLAGQTGVGAGTTAQGIAQLQAAAAAPNIQQFFNPFDQFVTDEILRQGQQMQNQLSAQAVGSGAFGGGREGVQQAELQNRILSNVGRARQQGFGTALQAAQNQQRTQAAVGQQLLGAGQLQQQMGQQDINQLMSAGGVQRQLAQAALDAQRQSTLQQQFEPFQRAEFLANLYAAGPKTQSGVTIGTAPSTSPLAQAVGTGIGAFTAFQNTKG